MTDARSPNTKTLYGAAFAAALLVAGFVFFLPAAPAENSALTDPVPDWTICRVDLEGDGDPSADAFYLGTHGQNDTVRVRDIRIVPVASYPAGSVVKGGDSDLNLAVSCGPYTVAYYDVNGDAVYDQGDTLLVGLDGDGNGRVVGSWDLEWWIRLTPSMGKAAGTVLMGDDADFNTFLGGEPATGAEAAFVDFDGSAAYSVDEDAYMTSRDIVDGESPPPASVVLVHPSLAFGTQVGASNTTSTFPTGSTTNTTGSPTPTTSTPPPPRAIPIVELTSPQTGDVVRFVVSVQGTVQFTEGNPVRVFLYATSNASGNSSQAGYTSYQSKLVATPGAWKINWDTRAFPDGPVSLRAWACYEDYWSCGDYESANVRVHNVVVQRDNGIVGCAVHVGPAVVDDLCNGISKFTHPVHPHLQSATIVLRATQTLTPLPIHDLRLTVWIGKQAFVAEGPSASLTLDADDLGEVQEGIATLTVSVGEAGLGPDVALDESFTLDSTFSYK